jgi:glycosyltransferase involved in cell wall biosynthesis
VRLLFVTWDGPQVSYLESLFLPIFSGVRQHGIETSVIQFRWGSEAQREMVARECARHDIPYESVNVLHEWGAIGAALTAALGGRRIRRAVRTIRPDVIMPRSIMPAMAVLAAGGRRLAPLCFDADGLPAEERVEFGGLRQSGLFYRALKAIETAAIMQASSVLVRSDFAAQYLSDHSGVPRDRFHTVTNGRDPSVFTPGSPSDRLRGRRDLGISADAPLLIYVGSIGPQYSLNKMITAVRALRQRDARARLLVLTGSPEQARAVISRLDETILSSTIILRAAPQEVPRFIAAADAGLCFRANTLSMRAVAPVKLGEYLLCGVPVIGTGGIGDTSAAEAAGVFVSEGMGAEAQADWIVRSVVPQRNDYRSRARKVGLEAFSVQKSVAEYVAAISSPKVH